MSGDESRNSPALAELCSDFWNWRLKDLPEFATAVGINDYNDKLDDMSLDAYRRRYDQCRAFLKRAQEVQDDLTSSEDLVNLKALKAELQTYVDGFKFQGFLIPLTYDDGIHVELERLLSYVELNEARDFERLLARYQQIPTQSNQIIDLMREGVAKGVVHHRISMKGIPKSMARFIVNVAEDSPLWAPFTKIPDSVTEDQARILRDKARELIIGQISPAFKELKNYVENEYVTRPSIAANTLPDGEARYKQLLRFHTSTNLSAEEIHQMGLNEVERILKEMAKIVEELGFDMSVSEFSDMIRYDPKSYFNNPEDMMERLHEIVHDIVEPKMGDVVHQRPKMKLELLGSPSPAGVLGYYLVGSYDGTRPGVFHVNTQLYASIPKYEMMTFCLHEANPGHHLQMSYTMERPRLPFFRRVIEDRSYQTAPSRFPIHTGHMEGWGLYAEDLGFDMGLFDDPYDRYGHYSYEMYRACRLVVDTGMHVFGWSREKAIDYMKKYTALATKNIENEVDRYITYPGQAVGYKVGSLKIWELRRKAERVLADAFDLKKFHEVVLDSVGPLEIMEDEVNKWIEAEKP